MARVLLAVDPGSTQARGPLRSCLEAAGHVVGEAGDGVAVLAEVRTNAPDLLILDTALPQLDGLQVLARLRQSAAPAQPPVLVISNLPPVLGRQMVDGMGAAAYLPKPVGCQALCEAIDRALALAGNSPTGLANAPFPPLPRGGPAAHVADGRATPAGRETRQRPAG